MITFPIDVRQVVHMTLLVSVVIGTFTQALLHADETLSSQAVHMLVPGFSVQKLPIELTNMNNVRYRHDGVLLALGYNGNVWLLRDTDGDGNEDKATLFWDNKGRLRGPIGMVVTPPGYSHGSGVIVASKGKLSMLVDTDGDDVADQEKIIASGWKEIPQNVDAVGVAIAPDETLYFALGCANYANGFLIDKQGESQFDLKSERGTIQCVSPDWSKRETVCTGVRFPVSMDWTDEQQLITSEQEGATWLPNGNPFDELLHIQEGKHYGFPPRHPKHLPNVINEPAIFEYAPQHQSTCGIFFNRSVCGGPTFGPLSWKRNVFLCGQSRGQIFRTELIHTPVGYVARNQTIARLDLLTTDCTVTPDGSLLIATHSGPPDWGTGPEGKGSLFKIRYTDTKAAQPSQVYALSQTQFCIAMDRPLAPSYLKKVASELELVGGLYVQAGDTYASLKPPYEVVKAQSNAVREKIAVLSVSTTPDVRNILVETGPLRSDWHYNVRFPSTDRVGAGESTSAIDLAFELSGVQVKWLPPDGVDPTDTNAPTATVLPHVDTTIARKLTEGSSLHDAFWSKTDHAGRLTFETRFHPDNFLEPPPQLGAQLDYEPPIEVIGLVAKSDRSMNMDFPGSVLNNETGTRHSEATYRTGQRDLWKMSVATIAKQPVAIEANCKSLVDNQPRPIPLKRFRLGPESAAFETPSAPKIATSPDSTEVPRFRAALSASSWLRGRELFYGERAACSKCHAMEQNSTVAMIGPSLFNSPSREIDAMIRDIVEPSAMINPDHLGYVCLTKDGSTITGTLLEQSESEIVLGTLKGERVTVSMSNVDELKLSKVSSMPGDYSQRLTTTELQDIVAFLISKPLAPASIVRKDVPPARTKSEWATFRKSLQLVGDDLRSAKRLRIALVSGPKDHGPDEHDYPLFQKRWSYLLSLDEQVDISIHNRWPSQNVLSGLERADVIVFFSSNPAWNESLSKDLDTYLSQGGGLVFMHFALNGRAAPDALARRIGLACDVPKVSYRHGPLHLHWEQPGHPILKGLPELKLTDESYWNLTGDRSQLQILATQEEEGQNHPQIWTVEHGNGRVFASIVGHYSWTFDDPLYRVLLLRGIAWSANRDVDVLLPLATVGARLED